MVSQVVSLARVELLQGLASGEIQLAFQPQVDLNTKSIVAFEGVARWHHPKLGQLSPGLFFSLAAKEGLIGVMSRTLAAQAARAIHMWRLQGHQVDVSINVATSDVLDASFARDLLACVCSEGAKPEWIVLEVDEEELVCTGPQGMACLEILAGHGFKIALDAKGPPHLALDKRARALFCQLKCGGSTMLSVASRLHSVGASAFMRRIQAAQAAGIPVVAVGAETAKAIRQCYQIGFSRLQGHIISPPLTFQAASDMLFENPVDEARSAPETIDLSQSQGSELNIASPVEELQPECIVDPQPSRRYLNLFSLEDLPETEPSSSAAA